MPKLFTVSCILMLSCCKTDEKVECNPATYTTSDLTASELANFPYNGFDTTYFMDNHGDTNIVVGQGKQFAYVKIYNPNGPPYCARHEVNSQKCEIQFKPIRGNLSFSVSIKKDTRSVYITKPNYWIYYTAEWKFVEYADSNILLNGKEYKNVASFFIKDQGAPVEDTSYVLYYNIPYGVLYIKNSKEGEEYSIISRK